jgi:hypothetical protein
VPGTWPEGVNKIKEREEEGGGHHKQLNNAAVHTKEIVRVVDGVFIIRHGGKVVTVRYKGFELPIAVVSHLHISSEKGSVREEGGAREEKGEECGGGGKGRQSVFHKAILFYLSA